jgi:hypothetical protein
MPYLAYGICWHQTSAPLPAEGELVVAEELALVLGRRCPSGQPDVSEVLAFAQAVEALHRHGPLLPIRYGTVFGDAAQAEAFLRQRAASLRAKLQALGDCEEATITFAQPTWDLPPATPPAAPPATAPAASPAAPPAASQRSGAAYLQQRRQQYEQKDRQQRWQAERLAEVQASLAGLFRDLAADEHRQPPPPRYAVQLLITRGAFPALRDRFAASQLPHQQATLTGPYPCWHFGQLEPAPTTRSRTS